MRLLRPFAIVIACLAGLAATGCRRETSAVERKLGFDEFVPSYNRYIRNWLLKQQQLTAEEVAKLTADIAAAPPEAKAALEARAAAVALDQEKWEFRLGLGDYLKLATPADIPAGLVWENGLDQPEIGDPAAKKGGIYNTWISTFPPTIRIVGDNGNNSFRSSLYDDIDLKIVWQHPLTGKMIPGVANEWATSTDGRTFYFKLDPNARYSNGEAVTAKDYLLTAYIYASDNLNDPYPKQFFRETSRRSPPTTTTRCRSHCRRRPLSASSPPVI